MDWYRYDIERVFNDLDTSPNGLTQQEAEVRLEKYGPNILREFGRRTPFQIFVAQFKDVMILILIGAAVISGFLGELMDAIAITTILLVNAVMGFIQEFRAQRAIEALKNMAAPNAMVKRREGTKNIPAQFLVPGDVVILEAGNIVPADLRLLDATRLRVEEAVLTGESVPVEKDPTFVSDQVLPLGDRKNMAFKGTMVTHGRGMGIVVATGMSTEFGKIAAMLQQTQETMTPLQKRLSAFGRHLSAVVLAVATVVFFLGLARGEEPLHMFLVGVSLAVAAIPEALPAVITIALALGAKKMVEHNALIRKLPAVETLGSVTYICTDKTGTLTENKMVVDQMWLLKDDLEYRELLFKALALSNDVIVDENGNLIGDPTEVALYQAAEKHGMTKEHLEKTYPRVAEIPFDFLRKRMTTAHRLPDGRVVSYTKGAPEVILERLADGQPSNLKEICEEMTRNGLRVLAVSFRIWRDFPKDPRAEIVEADLTFVGFVGLVDPPRPEAASSVALCKSAGIRPVMITGDHPFTAAAVARRIGITEDQGEVITGAELDRLSDSELLNRVLDIRVYARVAPEQKLRIVEALQERGHFVAMTGDGVNDAPALKKADIGVAMGRIGTDVAKEASDLILLDDNFATIVRAVREGRRIFDNIRKFIKYTMTSNSGEIWTILLAPILGLPVPLLPIHILWINMVTDGIPGLALAAEPEEKGLMKRPPRHPRESIFAHGLGTHIIWVGFLMGIISLFTQVWGMSTGRSWQTMVFTVLTLSQIGHAFAVRSDRESLFTQGLMSNLPLVGAGILTFVLQMATIYVPFFNAIFRTQPLTPGELIICLGLAAIVFTAVEIEKLVKRRLVALS